MVEGKREVHSVAAGLFYGQIEEREIFPYPSLTDEQKEIAKEMTNAVKKFTESSVDPAKMDLEGKIPEEVLKGLSELGLMGLGVSDELGGLGLDYTLYCRVFASVAHCDGSLATTIGAHQSIGYRALINDGSDEQRAKWLPSLASGEKVAAFCLTEPGSGSDAYSIKTKAVKNPDGSYTLTGQKLWITNAGMADFYTVFSKTDHEIDGEIKEKITCFIVEKSFEGVSFGEKEKKLGIRASETRAVFFDKVQVPAENIIGEEGRGFKIAMNVLNSGRLSLGAGCIAGMKYGLELASAHAAERKQFNQTINQFGIIQKKLATMAANIYMCESLVYFSTGKMDQGLKDYSFESAMCKVMCSEKLWETVDMSLQIAGGTGYMEEYPYEKLLRDSRINLIFEGTNEILRVFIALSGMKGPGDSLKNIGRLSSNVTSALQDPIKSVGVLTTFARSRFEKMFSKTLTQCHKDIEGDASKFSGMLSDFAIQIENTLMKYGKNIIGNELPQERIAEMALSLYTTICVLSRTTSILNNENIDDETKEYIKDLTALSCRDLRKKFNTAYRSFRPQTDKRIQRISEQVSKREGIGFDIIDF